jgi:hypothetical protein
LLISNWKEKDIIGSNTCFYRSVESSHKKSAGLEGEVAIIVRRTNDDSATATIFRIHGNSVNVDSIIRESFENLELAKLNATLMAIEEGYLVRQI